VAERAGLQREAAAVVNDAGAQVKDCASLDRQRAAVADADQVLVVESAADRQAGQETVPLDTASLVLLTMLPTFWWPMVTPAAGAVMLNERVMVGRSFPVAGVIVWWVAKALGLNVMATLAAMGLALAAVIASRSVQSNSVQTPPSFAEVSDAEVTTRLGPALQSHIFNRADVVRAALRTWQAALVDGKRGVPGVHRLSTGDEVDGRRGPTVLPQNGPPLRVSSPA
jgi:hypothetical protein